MDLASKSLSVLIRDVFLLFSTLLTSVVIARTLGPEIMGVWIILNIIPSYAEMFGRPKVEVAAIYFLGKKFHSVGDVLATLNLIAGIVSSLIVVMILGAYDFLSVTLLKDDADKYSLSLVAVLMVIPLNFFYLNYMYLHTFKEDVLSINYMILSKALSMSCLLVPGLLFFDFAIPGLVFCLIFSHVLSLTIGIYRFDSEKRKGPVINIPLIKDLFNYAYKMYFSGLLINLNTYLASGFLLIIGSATQITFFALAQQFSQILLKITDSLNTFVFPSASKKDSLDAQRLVAKAFRISIVMMLPVGIISSILIYPAIYLLYGVEYLPLVKPFLILLIGVVCSSITGTLLMYFMGEGKPGILVQTLVLPVLIQLAFGSWAVQNYGINGAAALLSLGMGLAGSAQVLLFLKHTNMSFLQDLIFTKTDIHTVVDFSKRLMPKKR